MSLAPAPLPQNVKDQVSAVEWQTRVDLAACYRLVAMHGWKTESLENMAYILQRPEVKKHEAVSFFHFGPLKNISHIL